MRDLTKKYGILELLMVIVFACFGWAGAVAQTGSDVADVDSAVTEAQTGGEQADIDEPSRAEEKAVLTELEQRMQKTVSIDVNELPIDIVIKQLAEQADLNIIKSPKVTGDVTVMLKDVPLVEALKNILAVHGCTYVLTDNMIRVVTLGDIVQETELLVTKLYHITYADVTQVEESLKKCISQRGSVSANTGTSHIIVTDTESNIMAIDAFIEEIDNITRQILVEVRIYDITSRDNLDLGIDWYAGRRTGLNANNYPSDADITVSKGGNPTYVHSITDPSIMGGFAGSGAGKTDDTTLGYLNLGVLTNSIDIDAQLRAEQENIDAKLLANPRIMVVDNEQAVFDIITEHPYVERTISGNTITETVKFKEVGVKLVVTPHITRDDMLRLHIMPEFGVVVSHVTVATSDVPVVDTRKFDTIALVKDNQTVVLGGLRKKSASRQLNKIPLLGDLPLFGGLFRFEGEATAVTELVVFITPRIVKQPVLSEDEQVALDATEFNPPKPVPTKAEKKSAEKPTKE